MEEFFFRAFLQSRLAVLLKSQTGGILFVDPLNEIRMGGFKLGFWFAQQGAIYGFVVIIFLYVILMNRLDKKYDLDEK